MTIPGISPALRERRGTAGRLPPLACGHRDPLLCLAARPGPSTYGLTRAQLASEVARCRGRGRSEADLAARFNVRQAAP
ncbi:hypothetical protein ACFOOM_10045 [Streptomyces echinoruber]|uniref:Uncharacterized protein n=1 Tax=Streptomyces echinoruber TaxID=68898 RepID=A0A918S4C9_9ACTN|nr:hypothetical protein [Streptomyces echinoruber]GHA19986.1 hypothetical protein GCM10010389_66610 [Streptomyces echinoruber]